MHPLHNYAVRRAPVRLPWKKSLREELAEDGASEGTVPAYHRRWDIDTGKGFTQIPHLALEKIMRAQLSGPDLAVLLTIVRKTVGWNKTTDEISITQFMTYTGCDKRTVQKSLRRLVEKKIALKLSQPTTRRSTRWAINRVTRHWPMRDAKPRAKSAASIRYMNAAKRGGKRGPLRVRIVARTTETNQYIPK